MAGNSPIDRYLTDLHAHVAVWHRRPDEVVAEARDHLHERSDQLAADGVARSDADRRAITEHGTPHEVADAHLRLARRPAIPTTTTRDLGVAATVGGLLWIVLPLLTWALPDSTPYWVMLASLFHGAVVASAIGCIGLWLRHGGLGPLAIIAVVPALLAAPFVLFVWPIPAWAVLLGLASLLFGTAVLTRRVVPLAGSIPATFGLAITGGAIIAAELVAPDGREDFAFLESGTTVALAAAGMIVFGAGMAVLGRWMRSETPIEIPELPAPTVPSR